MFRNVHYNAYENKLYLWETINGKRKTEVTNPDFEYYIEDSTGNSEIKDIYGTPVVKRVSDREGMKSVISSKVKSYETDISMDIKYLHKKYETQKLVVNMNDIRVCHLDIEIESSDRGFKAEDAAESCNLISVWFSDEQKLYSFSTIKYTGEQKLNFLYCASEKEMYEKFLIFWRRKDPDVVSGWYVDDFDMPYMIKRMEKIGVDYTKFSPVGIVNERQGKYTIAGVSILDYIELYKKRSQATQESYSLNSIGLAEIGEGKLDFEGQINDLYKRDPNRFIEYNIQDVMLVVKLDAKLRYIELAINIAYQALIPFEKTFSSMAVHTGYILRHLHKNKLVMHSREHGQEAKDFEGGYTFAAPGLYDYVVSYDVESMYPTMIRTFNIGSETLVLNPASDGGLIKTPIPGTYYRRDKKSVISDVTSEIFSDRKMFKRKKWLAGMKEKGMSILDISKKIGKSEEDTAKEIDEIIAENGNSAYYDSQQYVRKIMINSLYGVLGNPHFAFFNVNNARAVTLSSQCLIKLLQSSVNDYFKNYFWKNKEFFPVRDEKNIIKDDVIKLLDTDSLYICLDPVIKSLGMKFKDNKDASSWITAFCTRFLDKFFEKVIVSFCKKYDVENLINFKREKISSPYFVVTKKRYIAKVIDDEGTLYENGKLTIKGLQLIRNDTPKFFRDKLKETVEKMFELKNGDLVIEEIRKIKSQFKSEDISNIATTKGISDYQKQCNNDFSKGIVIPKGCPIHVRAAINYNYLVRKNNWKLQQAMDGTKIKYIYLLENNELRTDVIGFIGNWPKEFEGRFKIDYDTVWEKGFQSVFQDFYDILNWGKIDFSSKKMKGFFQ